MAAYCPGWKRIYFLWLSPWIFGTVECGKLWCFHIVLPCSQRGTRQHSPLLASEKYPVHFRCPHIRCPVHIVCSSLNHYKMSEWECSCTEPKAYSRVPWWASINMPEPGSEPPGNAGLGVATGAMLVTARPHIRHLLWVKYRSEAREDLLLNATTHSNVATSLTNAEKLQHNYDSQ